MQGGAEANPKGFSNCFLPNSILMSTLSIGVKNAGNLKSLGTSILLFP